MEPGKRLWMVLPGLALMLAACVADGGVSAPDSSQEPFVGHGEASDFDTSEGSGKADALTARFDPHHVMAENFFTAADAVSAADVQRFLEETPYGTRCWLADEVIHGLPASEAITRAAREARINPIVMLARMQVEKSLISKTPASGSHAADFAFGCGCPDYQSCAEQFRGLDNQIACAASVLRRLHDESREGVGQWRVGKGRQTLDGITIRPANHATAALYGYTPWVLTGQGGNWLVWNITRRFALHFEELGLIDLSDPSLSDPFVGTPCDSDDDCLFDAGGEAGLCHRFQTAQGTAAGFCTLPCEGPCPDLAGHASTFCTSLDSGFSGSCVSQASAANSQCASLPGTTAQSRSRFVGTTGASVRDALVCVP